MTRNLYLALGDSITAGIGASNPQRGFVLRLFPALYQANLVTRYWVIAHNGWTARRLLTVLQTVPASFWTQVRLVTVCIGGNDLRQMLTRRLLHANRFSPPPETEVHRAVHDATQHLREICHLLQQREVPRVALATVYNPIPHASIAVSTMRQLNTDISETAKQYRYPVVDLAQAFDGAQANLIQGYRHGRWNDLLVPWHRPIHPNDAGHQCIADLFGRALQERPQSKAPGRPQKAHHRRICYNGQRYVLDRMGSDFCPCRTLT